MKSEETKSSTMMEGGSTSGLCRFVKNHDINNNNNDPDQERLAAASSSTTASAARGTNGAWVLLLVLVFLVNSLNLDSCDGFSLAARRGAFRHQRPPPWTTSQPPQLQKKTLLLLSPPSSSSSSSARRNLHQLNKKKANHSNDTFRQFYKVLADDDTAVVVTSSLPSISTSTTTTTRPAQAAAILYDDFPAATTSAAVVVSTTRNGAMQNPPPPPNNKEEEDQLVATASAKNMARWLLIVSAALYGTNFAVVKSLVDVIPPEIFGTMRFGLAALATLPWLVWPSDKSSSNTKQLEDGKQRSFWQSNEWGSTMAGLEVGVWTSIGYLAQAEGLGTTLASTSAFVCSLAVVVVPVLDLILSGGQKRGRREQWFGMVMALVGVALLEFGSNGDSFVGFSRGDLVSLIQPFAFGIGFIRMEAAMRKFPTEAKRTTAGQLLAVFFASAAYMALQHPSPAWDTAAILQQTLHDPMIWAGLVWTGIVTTALTVYMETVALQTLTATETTVIFSTEPLWGALTAALLLGESFGPKAIAGGGLVIGACLVSSLGLDGLKAFLPFGQPQQQQTLPPVVSLEQQQRADDDIRQS
jgi:drug/metabolite transporter (DMT)-like permease